MDGPTERGWVGGRYNLPWLLLPVGNWGTLMENEDLSFAKGGGMGSWKRGGGNG